MIGESLASVELSKLRNAFAESKSQVQALKEDNMRKAKLLTSMKEAKTTDSNALEQWKTECKDVEENNKR